MRRSLPQSHSRLLTIITSCKVGGPGTMSIHAIGAMGGQPLLEPLLKEILNGKHRYAWLYANRVAVSSYVYVYVRIVWRSRPFTFYL